ncbi:MAG: hypothetical protein FRX49_06184 [Trebouxia sp. A1-2]|nr:MAG: hypothetical protein FRX49_06184 [Trebouxia sp. A1-2]
MPALLMPLALEMVATLLWALLVKVVSVRFLERQLMAGMLLGLLVGDMVEVLVEAAAGRLILLLIGVLETGHLEAEVIPLVLRHLPQQQLVQLVCLHWMVYQLMQPAAMPAGPPRMALTLAPATVSSPRLCRALYSISEAALANGIP